MTNLDDIGIRTRTDKSSGGFHHYLPLYDLLFRHWRNAPIRLLEIGTQFGCSLKAWREYFPYGFIQGIDAIDNNCPVDGTDLFIGNAYDEATMLRLLPQYDIVIDDGSHSLSDQQFVVANYSKRLALGGLLIVEDVLSRQTIDSLKLVLPEEYNYSAVDMTEGLSAVEGLADSRLFLVWRK